MSSSSKKETSKGKLYVAYVNMPLINAGGKGHYAPAPAAFTAYYKSEDGERIPIIVLGHDESLFDDEEFGEYY